MFNGDYPTDYGYITADHIEVIGEMVVDGFWETDEEAARHAERYCGYSIIRDIEDLPMVFLDTDRNREKIMEQIRLSQNSKRMEWFL